MKAVVAAFNQEKALVGAFSVITNLRMDFVWSTINLSLKLPVQVVDGIEFEKCEGYKPFYILLMMVVAKHAARFVV